MAAAPETKAVLFKDDAVALKEGQAAWALARVDMRPPATAGRCDEILVAIMIEMIVF